MRLLVLGGTRFVGRTLVETAVAAGWDVTTFNRGSAPPAAGGVVEVVGDRLSDADLAALGRGQWDVAVDTWTGAPAAVLASCRVLRDRVGRYAYLSTRAVYVRPVPAGLNEAHPTVTSSASGGSVDYAHDKRGGEMAVESVFGSGGLLLRCGLILGPHEQDGRLPYWLLRLARGGEVLAPGPPDLPVQYVDVRDLTSFTLRGLQGGLQGAYNVVCPVGHASMASFLETGASVVGATPQLIWVDAATIEAAGVERRLELPGWFPSSAELEGMYSTDVSRAVAAGLTCRPLEDTMTDTWGWLVEIGLIQPHRPGMQPLGMDPKKERAIIAAWRAEQSGIS